MSNQKKSVNSDSCLESIVCSSCGKHYDPKEKHGLCPSCHKVLFANYDLEKARESLTSANIKVNQCFNIWRFSEIMPVKSPRYRYSLGEGWTPLLHLKNTGKQIGLKELYLKDEGQNPTGTFKSRGLCAAISKGCELGIQEYVIPTAGNAGAALAAYASCAGVHAHVFMPEDTPSLLKSEVLAMGGDLKLVLGLISDAAIECKKAGEENGWFDVSTLKEPYRVEGKKTMGFEVVEQYDWSTPDVIIYPTGGGTGIIGMWKAFEELEKIGLIDSERPRMVSVQTAGCAPIVKAFQEKKKESDFWENAFTIAPGLRIPQVFGDYLILKVLYESQGTAITVDDSEMMLAMKNLAKQEGIMQAPEGAATFSGVQQLKDSGFIDSSETIILFGTGSGLIYPELWNIIK